MDSIIPNINKIPQTYKKVSEIKVPHQLRQTFPTIRLEIEKMKSKINFFEFQDQPLEEQYSIGIRHYYEFFPGFSFEIVSPFKK